MPGDDRSVSSSSSTTSTSIAGVIALVVSLIMAGVFIFFWLADNHQKERASWIQDARDAAQDRMTAEIASKHNVLAGQHDALAAQVNTFNTRIDTVERKVDTVDTRLTATNALVNSQGATIANLVPRVIEVEKQAATLATRIDTETADRKAGESKTRREYNAGFAAFNRKWETQTNNVQAVRQQVKVIHAGANEAVLLDFLAVEGSMVSATAIPVATE